VNSLVYRATRERLRGDDMSAEVIREELHGCVLTLTLERPHKRNAMNTELVDRLQKILVRLENDGAVRAIVLVGAGPGFCAGSDLAELARASPEKRMAFERESGLVARQLMLCSKPVIAAVHGFALGGGLTLATSCDIVVTSALANWSLPEVPIGLFPAWGLHSVVARVGVARTRQLSFGMEVCDGTEAVRIGLADKLDEHPLSAGQGIALQLASLPPAQVTAVKQYFADAAAVDSTDSRANEIFLKTTESPEGRALLDKFSRR
jgi:enoyl-CoA hydratase/carnithine racemase